LDDEPIVNAVKLVRYQGKYYYGTGEISYIVESRCEYRATESMVSDYVMKILALELSPTTTIGQMKKMLLERHNTGKGATIDEMAVD